MGAPVTTRPGTSVVTNDESRHLATSVMLRDHLAVGRVARPIHRVFGVRLLGPYRSGCRSRQEVAPRPDVVRTRAEHAVVLGVAVGPEAYPPVHPDVVAEEVLGVHGSVAARGGEIVLLLDPTASEGGRVGGGISAGELPHSVRAVPLAHKELRRMHLRLRGRGPGGERSGE